MKDRFKKIIKTSLEYAMENKKLISGTCVILALFVVCTASLVTKANSKNDTRSVTIALSTVKAESEAFGGETFIVSGLSYTEMKNANYDNYQLSQLEKTEKQVEEILTARSQDKKDQAVYDALTASSITPTASDNISNDTFMVAGGGVAEPVYADENGVYEYMGEFRVTAYCPCPICCGKYSNMENPTTASGTQATAGRTIAADSRFPFGTQLVVNGQVYTVEDRGGAINGNKIDVYFNSHEEALSYPTGYYSVYRKIQ